MYVVISVFTSMFTNIHASASTNFPHVLASTAAENSRRSSSRSRRSDSGHASKPRKDEGPGGET